MPDAAQAPPGTLDLATVLTFNNGHVTLEVSGIPVDEFGDVLAWLGSQDAGEQMAVALSRAVADAKERAERIGSAYDRFVELHEEDGQ